MVPIHIEEERVNGVAQLIINGHLPPKADHRREYGTRREESRTTKIVAIRRHDTEQRDECLAARQFTRLFNPTMMLHQ